MGSSHKVKNVKKDVIELYIKSKIIQDTMARDDIKCYNSPVKRSGFQLTTSTTYQPRDEDEEMKKILKEFAEKYKLKLEIHDLANKKEKRRAMFKRIKKTPIFFINGRRFDTMLAEAELLKLMT